MKWKTNWKKGLRNGICVGTLLLFLFQFAAMAQEGGTAAQEEPSKISPLLLEAFAQQPAPMSLDAQAEGIPRELTENLHDLLLIHDTAVGHVQNRLQGGV